MSGNLRQIGLGLGAILAMTGSASAQVVPMSFSEILDAADTVVVAEAIDSRADWVTIGSSRVIVTRVTFRVFDTLKGIPRVLLPLEFLGGTFGTIRQEVSGVPQFAVGDRAVLFVSGARAPSPIIGQTQGWFPINVGPEGTEYVTLHDRRAFSAVQQVRWPITVSPVPVPTMLLEAFGAEINRLLLDRTVSSLALPIRASTPTNVTMNSVVADTDTLAVVASLQFPPRDQTLNFFLGLENEYRDTLGRQRNNQGFVNAEGSAVWFPEWLRYVLNECSVTEATNRVLMQIRGQGIQPVCGVVAPGVIDFPPRDQSLDFLNTLDTFYRDELNRAVQLSYIDLEGKAVWLQEYLRYRVNGCDDTQATDRVFQQIRGGGISPVCGLGFQLSCGSSGLTLDQSNITTTCTVTSILFSNLVDLTCLNQPSGVLCAFNPSQVTVPAGESVTANLTIDLAFLARPGTYTFQVAGTDADGLTELADLQLTITERCAGFAEQPSYTGNACGTGQGICWGFRDGYRVFTPGEGFGAPGFDFACGDSTVQVARGSAADYQHVLGTILLKRATSTR